MSQQRELSLELLPPSSVGLFDCDESEQFGNASRPNIYGNLARHQIEEDWESRELMQALLLWAAKFTVEFKLEIPELALSLAHLSRRRYGHFRPGHNSFGLKGEIAINRLYLPPQRPLWRVLGTLLHELLHAWQQAHGTPGKGNHHNRELRDKARSYGLLIDGDGVTEYAEWSPFKEILHDQGIDLSDPETPVSGGTIGGRCSSKLKKWSCGCTNVRVAVAEFRAMCLKCGREFKVC
jgi:hypothetical protein